MNKVTLVHILCQKEFLSYVLLSQPFYSTKLLSWDIIITDWNSYCLIFFVKTKTRNQMKCGKLSSENFERFIFLINRCKSACFWVVSVKLEPRFLYLDRYLSALRATAKDEWILIISLQPRLLLCGQEKRAKTCQSNNFSLPPAKL